MGIISTFDPKFQRRVIQENRELYGKEDVIYIRKSKLFFVLKVLIPAIFWMILLIFVLAVSIPNISAQWFLITVIVVFIGLRLIPIFRIIKFYLDYKMDFIIVNPRSFLRYNQEGFFKRISKTIDLKKIRSISIRKKGLINSVFNNGTLVVLSEGGEVDIEEKSRAGEIVFRYVYDPETVDKLINGLFKRVFHS
ncbi:MAG TPA: hypothetical protein P5060_03655 [Candidatus Absconditabacterales bacterium]|nr:hypothetical protein [Candidatus Absconditabacterales bacterium]